MKRIFSFMAAFALLIGTICLSNPINAMAATYKADMTGFTSVDDDSWVPYDDFVLNAISEHGYNQVVYLYDYEKTGYASETYYFMMYDSTKYDLGVCEAPYGDDAYQFTFYLFDKEGNKVANALGAFMVSHIPGSSTYSYISDSWTKNQNSFNTISEFKDTGNPAGYVEDTDTVYDNIAYTSRSIYISDGSVNTGSLFYDIKVSLSEVATEANLFNVVSEVLSLLPIIIPVIIAFIGLRKSIEFLRGILHSA